MSAPNSAIVWTGPSAFTGRDVDVLLQCIRTPSVNEKTGPMVQVSIVQAGENPSLLRGTPREGDVCGACRGQKRLDGWCYEDWLPWLIGQQRHRAARLNLAEGAELLRGRDVRIGAYGDPAAVFFEVWRRLLESAQSWTGYTHAWRTCDQRFRDLCMASVEDHRQATEALALGWRYFRIRQPGELVLPSELACLNETRGARCIDCGFCDGTRPGAQSVVITAHGPRSARLGKVA